MLHSAILLTFNKLPFSFVLSIFKWPLKTVFTAVHLSSNVDLKRSSCIQLLNTGYSKDNFEIPSRKLHS